MAQIEDADFPADMWPTNVMVVLAEEMSDELPELETIAYRRLTIDDAAVSAGVFVEQWEANEFCIGQSFPELTEYRYGVEIMIRGSSRAMTVGLNAQLTKKLRAMLYRATNLYVRLPQLSESSFGITERYMRLVVGRQAFETGVTGSNAFVAASTTTITIQTENSQ